MTSISVKDIGYRQINELIRESHRSCSITDCCGQRFIAAGMADKELQISGVPGNALGAYLNGASITVHANAQDAVGDTMNDGEIIIHGNIGDAAGYAMRGGSIYVRGNAGYRAGIHMKAYKDKIPVLVIGGVTGSFLGEYQAGGIILVLGLAEEEKRSGKKARIVGNFPCTGMHGGVMYLRSDCKDILFPDQVSARPAEASDLAVIRKYVSRYCKLFGTDVKKVMDSPFTVITPDSRNPYHQLYVPN